MTLVSSTTMTKFQRLLWYHSVFNLSDSNVRYVSLACNRLGWPISYWSNSLDEVTEVAKQRISDGGYCEIMIFDTDEVRLIEPVR